MTASFAQGSTGKKYPYYNCGWSKCPDRRKSHRAEIVHREFTEYLRSLVMPPDYVIDTVKMITAHTALSDVERQERVARVRADVARVERQMTELVEMRSSQLLTDDEFVQSRDALREHLLRLRASDVLQEVMPLAERELTDFAAWLVDPEGFWHTAEIEQKHAFVSALFGQGYVFRNIRTSQSSLVFKVFEPSAERNANWVRHANYDPNEIIVGVRAFLAAVQPRKVAEDLAA